MHVAQSLHGVSLLYPPRPRLLRLWVPGGGGGRRWWPSATRHRPALSRACLHPALSPPLLRPVGAGVGVREVVG